MQRTSVLMTIGTVAAMLMPATSMALSTRVSDSVSLSSSTGATLNSPRPADTETDFLNTFLEGTGMGDDGLGAVFDVRAFRSHPCFNAVGAEQDYCLNLMGITTDFESMVEGDALSRLILEHAMKQRCEDMTADERANCMNENALVLPQLLLQLNLQTGTGSDLNDNETASETDEDTEGGITLSRYARSQRLWEMCAGNEETQAGCYQNYIRFVTDDTVSLNELEDVLGTGSSDDQDETNDDEEEMTDDNDVQSAEDEDTSGMLPTTRREREEWLWDLCADASESQSMCYRMHFRTAINENTDLEQLSSDIRS